MRDLKFRVWHKQEQKMYQPNYFHFSPLGDLYGILVKEGQLLAVDDFAVEQFTGIYDKNAKPIYEGDILKIPTLFGYTTVKVVYGYGAFLVVGENFNDGLGNMGGLEIIGNVREHPHLLEDKHDA